MFPYRLINDEYVFDGDIVKIRLVMMLFLAFDFTLKAEFKSRARKR